MSNNTSSLPLFFSQSAIKKIAQIINNSHIPNLKLRIYITGGGCSGFQYQFKFDNKQNKNDTVIYQSKSVIIVDHISLQYLLGGTIDYVENLEGSKFTILNPSAKATCGCGSSFSI